MNIIDGLATCFLCGETFDLGHHYEFHMNECLRKKRPYIKMDKEVKQAIIGHTEELLRHYMPGVLMGYGETV